MVDRDEEEKAATETREGAEDETVDSKDNAVSDESSGSDESDSDDDEEEEDDEEEDDAVASADAPRESRSDKPPTLLLAIAGLALGAASGWFGHGIKVQKSYDSADAAVQGTGDAARGPCKDWEKQICEQLGEKSHGCTQAKTIGSVLPGSSCEVALKQVASTVEKIKAARSSCETIMTKLCSEIGDGSKACELVKTQTPTFPPEKCDQMMESYPQILAQLQQMEKRGNVPGAGGPGGPGGPPMRGPGMPPGASPHSGASPHGSAPGLKAPAVVTKPVAPKPVMTKPVAPKVAPPSAPAGTK
jgi:hypothetical protein